MRKPYEKSIKLAGLVIILCTNLFLFYWYRPVYIIHGFTGKLDFPRLDYALLAREYDHLHKKVNYLNHTHGFNDRAYFLYIEYMASFYDTNRVMNEKYSELFIKISRLVLSLDGIDKMEKSRVRRRLIHFLNKQGVLYHEV